MSFTEEQWRRRQENWRKSSEYTHGLLQARIDRVETFCSLMKQAGQTTVNIQDVEYEMRDQHNHPFGEDQPQAFLSGQALLEMHRDRGLKLMTALKKVQALRTKMIESEKQFTDCDIYCTRVAEMLDECLEGLDLDD
jgi:hypothetical protein